MSATIALVLLAETAAGNCAPARGVELPGGATIVRPVGTAEPVPFEQLGPAPGLTKPERIQQVDAPANPHEPVEKQCEVPIHIV